MHTNIELITRFYDSFAHADAEGMVGCYADDILFQDPAFGNLKGEDAKNMWRMLMLNGKGEIKITYGDISADDKTGSAKWKAEYIFSKTGRHVVNRIQAQFKFKDGKISVHSDSFNLWKWSAQALGWKGYLLGWSPFMKNKIQKQTHALLSNFTQGKN